MFLFGNKEVKIIELNLKGGQLEEDAEAGILSIEAYGNVDGENIYCYATYLSQSENYKNGVYDKILNIFENKKDIKIQVELIYKNKKLKDFKLDLHTLSQILECEEIIKLDLLGRGINKKSVFDA